MKQIENIEDLEQLYDAVVPGAIDKVRTHLTPKYCEFIDASRFVVLTTVGQQGTDASPRGDVDSVVKIAAQDTLWLPDWRGNNRLDSLRNIVEDGRVSLMFMVPGSNNVVRINGTAVLSIDPDITSKFSQNNKQPRSVIVISIAEVYFQCAKALMRSQLWTPPEKLSVPTAGQFIEEYNTDFDGDAYDSAYAEYAKDRMW